MTDPLQIRRARAVPADAQDLASVEHASLGDSDYTPSEMLDVLARPEHHAYLAYLDQAVGFCSCFETNDGRRLEVDMLGVLPAYRGRGIASRLIVHALDEARARGVRSARGVVAAGNVASQRAFAHAGFAALGDEGQPGRPLTHAMLVYPIAGLSPQPLLTGWETHWSAVGDGEQVHLDHEGVEVGAAECLCVQTLCYSGLWVERLEASSDRAARWLARALAERAKALELDEVGYLAAQPGPLPTNPQAPRCLSWVREGYRDMGDYLVFGAAWR